MTTVVVSSYRVSNFIDGGGHFWVYLQYVAALRALGCDVWWLEGLYRSDDEDRDANRIARFLAEAERHGLGGRTIVYLTRKGKAAGGGSFLGPPEEYVGMDAADANAVFQAADLLVNFNYKLHPHVLDAFSRSALIDIDPGLLQHWIAAGQLAVEPHDLYFTTGETVGTPGTRVPDCGFDWVGIRPSVCLDLWPARYDKAAECFTTVSSWWAEEWVSDGERFYDNNKRVSFLEFAVLPERTRQPLELALFTTERDARDIRRLRHHGWRVRHSLEVAGSPSAYRDYVQGSRGEFSCVKPSCLRFQNAWMSDRSLCYLASGKPVVVQHTGPSSFLPDAEGLFRVSTVQEAAVAIERINADYEHHCRAARRLAEEHFDARRTAETILERSLAAHFA